MNRVKFIYDLEPEKKTFPRLRKIVESSAFELTVVALILTSVVLILVEAFAKVSTSVMAAVMEANDILTLVFIVELSCRWLISVNTKSFLKTYWLDILAVMPIMRVFRIGRVLRLLRLFRVFSLGAEFQRKFTFLGEVFEGRIIEYGIIFSLILFAVIFGAVGLSQFEAGKNTGIITTNDAFWKSLFSLLAGEYADYPVSFGGKIVFLVLLLFQMGVFAMLTGTFSAVMIEKLKESAMNKATNPEDLKNHVIICGFSTKATILANEFLLDPIFRDSEILLVSENAELEPFKRLKINTDRISILKEDFTRIETLRKAGVTRASAAVILSERGENRTTHDIDARTLLAALTIERLNSTIHTSAEIYHEEYSEHLKMGGVEDVVIQGEVSGKLLARVAMHEGLLAFFKDLLSRESGNTLTFIEPSEDIVGLHFEQAMAVLHTTLGFILVGVKSKGKSLDVNPREHTIEKSDQLLVINPVSTG